MPQGVTLMKETSMFISTRTRRSSPRRTRRPTRGARRRPMVELLEVRRLLSTTITVNTVNDPATPVSGQTSLREAIAAANAEPGGGDTIDFASGLTGTIDLNQGVLPVITAAMTITGPGATTLAVDGLGTSGIFVILGLEEVKISGLTLQHANAAPAGAVYNSASLKISDCIITGNTAVSGGGVTNAGMMTISDTSILNNKATLQGGGVLDKQNGQLTMVNCTVANNTCTSVGGGVEASSQNSDVTAVLTMINCTVTGNSAAGGGGVGADYANVTLSDCTLAGNSAQLGGGIFNQFQGPGVVTLNNTIVAGNTTGGDIINRALLSGSHNLIGDASTAGGLENGVDGNIVGVDPKLGPLASNGGPTQTMALLPGSPAVMAGDNTMIPSGITTDQRGAPRIKDKIVDIGAFAERPRDARRHHPRRLGRPNWTSHVAPRCDDLRQLRRAGRRRLDHLRYRPPGHASR